MKFFGKLFVLAVLFSVPSLLHAQSRVWSIPVKLDAESLTETNVAISASANTILLPVNSDRLAFDIQISSCASPANTSTKIFYAYDGVASTVTATASHWIDTSGVPGANYFRQPPGIVHTGSVVAQAETAGCRAAIREWSSASPHLR